MFCKNCADKAGCAKTGECEYIRNLRKGNTPEDQEYIFDLIHKCASNPYPFEKMPSGKHFGCEGKDKVISQYACHRSVVNDALTLIRSNGIAFVQTDLALTDILKCQAGVSVVCASPGFYIFLQGLFEGSDAVGV